MKKINDLQVRGVIKENNKVVRYNCIKGVIWTSGYDERIAEHLDVLSNGIHIIRFYPDTNKGSDAIYDLEIS